MINIKHNKYTPTLTLAFCIALFPPIWAVFAPYINVTTGSVALICAGLYVAHGNKSSNALKISIGFLLGDIWAVIAIKFMSLSPLSANLTLFITLFVMGGLAVLLSALAPNFIDTPSWLCGWAIGLTILTNIEQAKVLSFAAQIAVSMLAGVWYVGVFVGVVQTFMIKKLSKGE